MVETRWIDDQLEKAEKQFEALPQWLRDQAILESEYEDSRAEMKNSEETVKE